MILLAKENVLKEEYGWPESHRHYWWEFKLKQSHWRTYKTPEKIYTHWLRNSAYINLFEGNNQGCAQVFFYHSMFFIAHIFIHNLKKIA